MPITGDFKHGEQNFQKMCGWIYFGQWAPSRVVRRDIRSEESLLEKRDGSKRLWFYQRKYGSITTDNKCDTLAY